MATRTGHIGEAGQRLVEARLLQRGWNVGSAWIDEGDDLFAIRESGSEVTRIQVKTANAEEREYGYSAQFRLGKEALERSAHPPMYFVFVASIGEEWAPLIVVSQPALHDLAVGEEMGSETEYAYVFYVRYHRGEEGIEEILCSESDLTEYMDDLSRWEWGG